MSKHDEYESGPYCKHWNDPGDCAECARERLGPEIEAACSPEDRFGIVLWRGAQLVVVE